jgi:hypothetical protein
MPRRNPAADPVSSRNTAADRAIPRVKSTQQRQRRRD